MEPSDVLALCREHAAAEAVFDVEGILATLVPDPTYAFYPANRSLSGWANIEAFYRTEYPRFARTVREFDLIGEWVNERTAVQEYVIDVGGSSADVHTYRVMSLMPVDEAVGRLSGETLYCAEGFVRHLLGDLWDQTEPLTG